MTRFRKPAILALAVLLLLSCFPAWAETAESAEQTLIRLVNEDRARYGLNALTVDPALCSVARIKAQDMLSGGYFAHTSPTYGDIRKMLTTFGASYTYASENIARRDPRAGAVPVLLHRSPADAARQPVDAHGRGRGHHGAGIRVRIPDFRPITARFPSQKRKYYHTQKAGRENPPARVFLLIF